MQLAPLLQYEWRRFKLSAITLKALRVITYLLFGIICFFALIDCASPMRDPGNNLFTTLVFCSASLLLIAGVGIAARFAADRESGLFGLLRMTPTTTKQFFLNRAVVKTLIALYFGLACVPFFGVAFLYGGVSLDRWLGILIFFPTAAAFCCACGFIGPIFTTNPIQAESISAFARLIIAGWPIALNYVKSITIGEPLPHWILSLGPLQGIFQLFAGFSNHLDFLEFLLTVAASWLETVLIVILGSYALEKTWRRDAGFARGDNVLSRIRAKSFNTWRAFLRPTLETQPLVWLAAHNRRHVAWAWIQLSALVAIWIGGFLAWGDNWVFPLNLYVTAALVLFIVFRAMAARIRSRAHELDKGDLDLIINTGVSPLTLIQAELDGLYLQFAALRWTSRAIVLVCLAAPLYFRTWNARALFAHLSAATFFLWASHLRPTPHFLRFMYAIFAPVQAVNSQNKLEDTFSNLVAGQAFIQILMHLNKSRSMPTGSTTEIFGGGFLLVFVIWRTVVSKRNSNLHFKRIEKFIRERPLNLEAEAKTV